MASQTQASSANSQIIARNWFWFGLELLFTVIGAFVTSVIVARVIGPERLGYYNYISFLTSITASIGTLGLPMTTRKYMAEYLNSGEPSVARGIYEMALKLQFIISSGFCAVALVLIFFFVEPRYRVVSVVLALGMIPRMLTGIPSQANSAAEQMKRNTKPGLISIIFNTVFLCVALWAGWDLMGVAVSFVSAALLETILKLRSVHDLLRSVTSTPITPELRKRVLSFSAQGLVLMILNVVIWDRSDLVFLKALNPDIRQVTFFSIAFGLTERLLMLPGAFVHSLNVTVTAQYGRGSDRLSNLAVAGAKYNFLLGLPCLVGVACISKPLVHVLYGDRYAPLAPVLAIATMFGLAKAMMPLAMNLLQTVEKQGFLIWVGCCGGAVDVLADILLTPRYGAAGAAVANGVAQTLAMLAVWVRAYQVFRFKLDASQFVKIGFSGLMMAAAAMVTERLLPTRAGLVLAVLLAAITWCVMLRLTKALDRGDMSRFRNASNAMPAIVRPAFTRLITLISSEAA